MSDGEAATKVAAPPLERARRLSFQAVYASVTTVRDAGPDVGVTAKMAADSMLSWLSEFEGYCGLLIIASPETGSARIMTLWESEESLDRSERSRAQVRESMIATAGAQLESVERYEVVLDERVDSAPSSA